MVDRTKEFEHIKQTLENNARFSSKDALLVEGDSLSILKMLPDHSISLILTDPPYHSTKKSNIYGDTHFEEDHHYLEWMAEFSKEWRRVLKPNGSLYCFCAVEMAARLEVLFSNDFNMLSHIVWTKPNEPGFDGWKQKMKKTALRQWYAHTERIIFAEPKFSDSLFGSYFGGFLREMRLKAGMSMKDLTEEVGAYGKVNHGGAVANWEASRNTPSREQYEKLAKAIVNTGKVKKMPIYEDVIRPFIIDGSKEFTDVWTFQNVRPYKGKHPAEKPADLLEHAIEASSYPGDIVLDCFGGSGSTAFSALKLGRKTISIEIETALVDKIAAELEAKKSGRRAVIQEKNETIARKLVKTPQLGLFGVK